MRKWVLVLVLMLSVAGLAVCAEEAAKPAETSDVAEKPVPPVKVEPIMVQPTGPLGSAKVLSKTDMLKFVPRAPKGWKTGRQTGGTQRPGVFAVTRVEQEYIKDTQRIVFLMEDLGTNNPYFYMKDPWPIKEKKTEESYTKKLMLGKVAAEENFYPKQKRGSIFLVFGKRVQLNIIGTGISDSKVLVEMAKTINFDKLKKTMEEKSK